MRDMNSSGRRPRVLIIGAGSRGNAYAKAIHSSGTGVVAAVAEPIELKRRLLGARYIWNDHDGPQKGQEYPDWRDYLAQHHPGGQGITNGGSPSSFVDAIFICVLDEQHVDVVTAFAPHGYHIMCEKPLATTLNDCLKIYAALLPPPGQPSTTIFGIGHVLRYSPHNMLLREIVLEQDAIGDVLSIEHTEPVGWWHYSHSYVR